MTTTSSKAARTAIAALLLCAVFGPARAEQLDAQPAAGPTGMVIPSPRDEAREEQAAARAVAERRQKMIEECGHNHGSEIDCERETDTELRAENLQWGVRVIHRR